MKPTLKLNFSDFWPTLNKEDNYFYNLLSQHYRIEISSQPELLIYSVFGKEYERYKCKRIFYSGENAGADYTRCDFALTGDYDPNPRHHRLPLYVLYFPPERFVKPEIDPEVILGIKRKFCSFVVSNSRGKVRNRFYKMLSKYKQVDSGGKYRNNIGYRVPDKAAFIRDYKFCLSFENESYPGYTTEKIIEPFMEHCIPIYWGNPLIHKDFNPAAFLNFHEYKSPKEFIERIIEVDNNDNLYMQYLSEPWCINNRLADSLQPDCILQAMINVIDSSVRPIAMESKSITHYVQHTLYRLKKKGRRGHI